MPPPFFVVGSYGTRIAERRVRRVADTSDAATDTTPTRSLFGKMLDFQ